MTSEDIKHQLIIIRPRRGEWGESVSGSALARARSDPVELTTILLYVHKSEVDYFRDGVRRRKK